MKMSFQDGSHMGPNRGFLADGIPALPLAFRLQAHGVHGAKFSVCIETRDGLTKLNALRIKIVQEFEARENRQEDTCRCFLCEKEL